MDIRARLAVALCVVLASVDTMAAPLEIRVPQPKYYCSSDEQLTKMQVFLQAKELELEERRYDPFLSTTFFWGTKGLSGTYKELYLGNPGDNILTPRRWSM